jgi:hypothetical protein
MPRTNKRLKMPPTSKQLVINLLSDEEEDDISTLKQHASVIDNLQEYSFEEEHAALHYPPSSYDIVQRQRKPSAFFDEFVALVCHYESFPTHDMEEVLTTKLAANLDLRECEQELLCKLIQELLDRHSQDPGWFDEHSCNLQEIISGKAPKFNSSTEKILHLVRMCMGALGTGDEDTLLHSYMQALTLCKRENIDVPNEIGFKHVMELSRFAVGQPGNTFKATEEQFKILSEAFASSQMRSPKFVLESAFEVISCKEHNPVFEQEPCVMLFHGTRSNTNITPILSQGLQPSKSTHSRLVWLSNTVEYSLNYVQLTPINKISYGTMFLAQVATGKNGYKCHSTKEITMFNGTGCKIASGSHNFAACTIGEAHRIQIRFILLFSNKSTPTPRHGHGNTLENFPSLLALQNQSNFKRKIFNQIKLAEVRHGANSPQVSRAKRIMDEVCEEQSLFFFSEIGLL